MTSEDLGVALRAALLATPEPRQGRVSAMRLQLRAQGAALMALPLMKSRSSLTGTPVPIWIAAAVAAVVVWKANRVIATMLVGIVVYSCWVAVGLWAVNAPSCCDIPIFKDDQHGEEKGRPVRRNRILTVRAS